MVQSAAARFQPMLPREHLYRLRQRRSGDVVPIDLVAEVTAVRCWSGSCLQTDARRLCVLSAVVGLLAPSQTLRCPHILASCASRHREHYAEAMWQKSRCPWLAAALLPKFGGSGCVSAGPGAEGARHRAARAFGQGGAVMCAPGGPAGADERRAQRRSAARTLDKGRITCCAPALACKSGRNRPHRPSACARRSASACLTRDLTILHAGHCAARI